MTNTPGEGQAPQDPYSGQSGQQEPPAYQAPGQNPYGQPQPYGQPPAYQQPSPGPYAPDHPKATTVLVLGILGIVLCGVIAPFAWSMGKRTVQEIDASNGAIGGRGAANAGYILGIVGTILLGFSVLVLVAVFGFAILGAISAGSGY